MSQQLPRIGFFVVFAFCLQMLSACAQAATLNVKTDCGATGLIIFPATTAINRCIDNAAVMPGGGVVRFPPGAYLSGSIHLRSHVTLQLDQGATIYAAPAALQPYDPAEPNPNDMYQGYGHSHFHNALIWGEGLTDIGIVGGGIIDGASNLKPDPDPSDNKPDKAVSLKESSNVRLAGITIRRGGHFAILANGIDTMSVDHVRIQADPLGPLPSILNSRDGFNLINSANVTIDNVQITGLPDDALALKSDYALGHTMPSTNIHVTNSTLSSLADNAIQFGSETCGDFSDIGFSDMTITGAGEGGISITSNDGAVIERISYDRIVMSGVAVPIWIKTGTRNRCPTPPRAGIIRDIALTDVSADASPSASGQEFTSTISGLPGVPVENVTLTRVNLLVPGGHPASDANIVPPEDASYNPEDQGTKPSYGWWLRHVKNIGFVDSKVEFVQNDGRPALIAVDGAGVDVDSMLFEVGTSSLYDLGFGGASTFTVGGGTLSTTGAAPRIQILP